VKVERDLTVMNKNKKWYKNAVFGIETENMWSQLENVAWNWQ